MTLPICGLDQTLLKRRASRTERALVATRSSANTDCCSEIDEAKRKILGIARGSEFGKQRPKHLVVSRPALRGRHTQASTDEPNDIRVDERLGPGERQDEDGVRDITADAGQREQACLVVRDSALISINQRAAEGRQAGAPVRESERSQDLYDLARICCGERLGVREAKDELRVGGQHGVCSRPLKEHFSHQDLVGIVRITPWIGSAVLAEPYSYAAAEPTSIQGTDDRAAGRRFGHYHDSVNRGAAGGAS